MPVYEVTAKVPSNVQAQWLEYMQKHVKDLIETKCFDGAAMRRVKVENRVQCYAGLQRDL